VIEIGIRYILIQWYDVIVKSKMIGFYGKIIAGFYGKIIVKICLLCCRWLDIKPFKGDFAKILINVFHKKTFLGLSSNWNNNHIETWALNGIFTSIN